MRTNADFSRSMNKKVLILTVPVGVNVITALQEK
jgi:hypothetical protein